MINRRSFLQLLGGAALASALPPIWFPLAPHNERQSAAELPSGLGLAIPLDFPGPDQQVWFDHAIEVFQPAWTYHWRQWPVTSHAGFVPMVEPLDWFADAHWLRGYVQEMRNAGVDVTRACWLIGNEPEYSGRSPQQSVEATMTQVTVMQEVGIEPTVIAPGSNIKDPPFDYLRQWCDAALRRGLSFTLAIHIYDWRSWRLDQLWQRFCQWFDATNLDQVLVTECGAGPDRTFDEWLVVMPWFYRLLDDPRVRALAGGAAYDITMQNGEFYYGHLNADGSVNELGQQWLAERDRRNDGHD